MNAIKEYKYTSLLSDQIKDFVAEKRALGYQYNDEAYFLTQFDQYWKENNPESAMITKNSLENWFVKRETETNRSYNHRIAVSEQFAKYLIRHNIECSFPQVTIHYYRHPIVHVLSDEELNALFLEIDKMSLSTRSKKGRHYQMAFMYSVLFRLVYCLGLRIGEAISLRKKDIDFHKGTIFIFHGKADKDRMLSMPDDLLQMCQCYISKCENEFKIDSEWLFPGNDPAAHVSIHTADAVFNDCWKKTKYSKICDKKPTVHCLRHTFVVKRLNLWMENGAVVPSMMMYLSKFLGHADINETMYYYHLVLDALHIIRKKDTVAESVIPEVKSK